MPNLASRYCWLALLSLVVLSCVAGPATAQKELRWKYEAGEKLKFSFSQKLLIGMTLGEKTMNSQVQIDSEMLAEVVKPTTISGTPLSQTITALRIIVTPDGGEEIVFDSEASKVREGSEEFHAEIKPIFDGLKGLKFDFNMTAEGNINDVKVPDAELKRMQTAAGLGVMSDLFSRDGFKKLLSEGMPNFPSKPVKAGDSWTRKFQVDGRAFGPHKFETTYTYRGEEAAAGMSDKLDVIDVAMKMEPLPDPMGASALVVVNSHAYTGRLFFNSATGKLDRSLMRQIVSQEVKIGNQTVKQDITNTVRLYVTPFVPGAPRLPPYVEKTPAPMTPATPEGTTPEGTAPATPDATPAPATPAAP